MRLNSRYYPTFFLTAVVAGLFSIIVCILLGIDYMQRVKNLPLESPEYLAIKEELRRNSDAMELRAKLRALDLQSRETYFRKRRFTSYGTFLLLGGLATTFLTARWAATLHRKLPMPDRSADLEDSDRRVARFGYPGIVLLGIVLAGAAVVLHVHFRSEFRIPTETAAEDTASTLAGRAPRPSPSPAPLLESALPTAEEIARQWPRFRGPFGNGISAYPNVPTSWDIARGTGILWKTAVPLPGNNSPVVWADRIFLTGATEERRAVFCFDADTGDLLWQTEVPAAFPGDPPPEVSEDTGYAAPTAATDGRRVFAMFANGDVAAVDFSGNLVWHIGLGNPKNIYGHAASLAIHRDLLLIQYDQGSAKEGLSEFIALNTATGDIVWKKPRPVPNSWSSPIVGGDEAKPQVITCGDPWVIAYAPSDGTELWRAKCLRGDIGPSPVFDHGMVYTVNEFPCLSALRADGQGDVTETHIEWTADIGLPDTCGPLVTNDYVLLLASYGTLTCYDKKEGGEPLWEMDFDGNFRSSPGLVGNRVYLFSEEGTVWIVELGREGGQQIAETGIGEPCMTSPAFHDGRIYIRGEEHLICIGNP